MIIRQFTDNDLYKFTTMYAIQKLYPDAWVRYKFINRGNDRFPEGFAEKLREEVNQMKNLRLHEDEQKFIQEKCYYFDPVFLDLLQGFRYNPDEVSISQENGKLKVEIEGYWFRTVLWEVPLLAIISELFFSLTGQQARDVEARASTKAIELAKMGARFSDFGTRRRFSFEVHDQVINTLKAKAGSYLSGTSNVFLAMRHNLTPIGTHPHEWFMYHAAHFGYQRANIEALKAWTQVYHGSLGIALTDTFTTDNFFESFELQYAKLFDGLRWDSGDAIEFTKKAIQFYKRNRIASHTKTIVYSDSLNVEKVREIKSFVDGKVNDAYGIGTYFTNDVGVEPLNIVIKLSSVALHRGGRQQPVIKLSDVDGKHTGNPEEIALCKQTLRI